MKEVRGEQRFSSAEIWKAEKERGKKGGFETRERRKGDKGTKTSNDRRCKEQEETSRMKQKYQRRGKRTITSYGQTRLSSVPSQRGKRFESEYQVCEEVQGV